MKSKIDTLRNKKRKGRGLRTGTGSNSHANTHQLRRILNCLELDGESDMTSISRNIGVKGYYVKDALLFLCGLGIIEKIQVSYSRAYYYKLKSSHNNRCPKFKGVKR